MARQAARVRGRPGGASAAAGIGFQEAVAAWLAVHMLVEEEAPPIAPLRHGARLVRLSGETEDIIDDIVAWASDGSVLYVQAKRAVPQLADRAGSDFRSFMEQAVDQHLALIALGTADGAYYVLATSQDASRAVRKDLRDVLGGLRDAPSSMLLSAVGSTVAQKTALEKTAEIARRRWRESGAEPSDSDLRTFLEHLAVWEHDFDGSDRSTAITLLNVGVVRSPSDGALAWTTLQQRAQRVFVRHETLESDGWRRALVNDGLELREAPSFIADLARVRAFSHAEAGALDAHRLLRMGGVAIEVARSITTEVRRRIADGPILVIGEPGSGKTAVLAAVAEGLRADGSDVVVLSAESVSARSLPSLQGELRLDHPLADVLDAWAGPNPAFLLVDGLDDTRASESIGALRQLVSRVLGSGGRWVPIVSVRRFDLRYSTELRRMFAGPAPTDAFQDPEFDDVLHVAVPDFDDAELAQLESPAPALLGLATDPLVGELLRRPIHLQIAADLLARGATAAEISPIRTQIGLLDMYWLRAVESPIAHRADREAVLVAAARAMVRDRQISLERSELDSVNSATTLELLGNGVLSEGRPLPGSSAPVRFAHLLIADYSISRLLLGSPEAVEAMLASDPGNALFMRPAIELRFRALWEVEETRHAFWESAIRVAANGDVPEIGKLIAPTVAAGAWKVMGDIEPLLEAIGSEDRAAALVSLRHLIGAISAPGGPAITGTTAAPWDELATALVDALELDLAFLCRLLLTLLTEEPSTLTDSQASNVGAAARRLLTYAWGTSRRDPWLVRWSMRAVCRTYTSDTNASRHVLCVGLGAKHVSLYGFEELGWIAYEVDYLLLDPTLLVALYTATFRFEDTSDEVTMLGSGPVLPLTSNRRQDFNGNRYELARRFPTFVAADPVAATIALMRALRGSTARRRHWGGRQPLSRIEVDGNPTRVRDDFSYALLDSTWTSEDEVGMSKAWMREIGTLAERGDSLEQVLVAFLSSNRLVLGWRLLLRAAAEHEALAPRVVALIAGAPALLQLPALGEEICRLAGALGGRAESNDLRAAIEREITEPEALGRLLGCLDGSVAPNLAGAFDPTHRWRDTGDDALSAPVTRTSRAWLEAWVESVAGRSIDELSDEELSEVGVHLETLVVEAGVHQASTDEGWRLVAKVAARLAKATQDRVPTATRAAAEALVRVLDVPNDVTPPEPIADDDGPGIGSHGCVLDGVAGFADLYASGRCGDIVTQERMLEIVDHPLPWARGQLARAAIRFAATDADLMWTILTRLASDPSSWVASEAAAMASWVRATDPERARHVMEEVVGRAEWGNGKVAERGVALAGLLALDGVLSIEDFRAVIGPEMVVRASDLLQSMRGAMTAGQVDGVASPDDDIRRRTLQVIGVIADVAITRYLALVERDLDADTKARDEFVAVLNVLGAMAQELYFGSGAYQRTDESARVPADRMARFFDEYYEVLQRLVPVVPARGIHNIVEIAAANTQTRPVPAFQLIADAVAAAQRLGYETDSLARDLVLRVVREYLSDRRELFHGTGEEPNTMRGALVSVLDTFVGAGWPEARAMAYHLHEVFR